MSTTSKAFAASLLLTAAPIGFGVASEDIQLDMLKRDVGAAAEKADLVQLHLLMVQDFRYSFGGNNSRDEAIQYYRSRPELLTKLAAILSEECAQANYNVPEEYVVCPAEAANPDSNFFDWRAGFRRSNNGRWEFVWFLAGD